MTTVRDAITQALKRIRIAAPGETPTAAESSDGLTALNQMLYAWSHNGVDMQHQGFALNDTFAFWVPPDDIDGPHANSTVMDAITYRGTWNASTGIPSISSPAKGDLYKVSVAGSSTLGTISTWAVGDFAVYTGAAWKKGESHLPYHQGVIANLAVRLADDYGVEVPAVVARDARDGWDALKSAYLRFPLATFDRYLVENRPSDGAEAGTVLEPALETWDGADW